MASNPIITVDPSQLDAPSTAAANTISVDPSELDEAAKPSRISELLPDAKTAVAWTTQKARELVDVATKPLFAPAGTGAKVTQPWSDLAQRGVEQMGEPFRNVPGAPLLDLLNRGIGDAGKAAGGAMDFATSPAGLASIPLAGSANPLVSRGTRAAFTSSMAPQAATRIGEAAKNPSGENVGSALVSTAAAALPVAPELAGARAPNIAGALDRHNAEAARLLDEERQQGTYSTAQGEHILGTDSMPVKIGDRTVLVQPAGESAKGRPIYRVIDKDSGKPVYGGYGDAVQGFLRTQGARPLDENVARYPESQPTGPVEVDQNDPSLRKMSPPASVPETGVSEQIARVQDARERLAQTLTGQPFRDLKNSERLVVDHFVSQGYGFAAQPQKEENNASESRSAQPGSETAQGPAAGGQGPEVRPEEVARVEPAPQGRAVGGAEQRGASAGTAAGKATAPPPEVAAGRSQEPGVRSQETEPALAATQASRELATAPAPEMKQEATDDDGLRYAAEARNPLNTTRQNEPPVENMRVSRGSIPLNPTGSQAREPATAAAYGRAVNVQVPGEQASYPAKYAVREAADVVPSHNPQSFAANPDYEYQNDRDYSQADNAARVIEHSSPGKFSPEYTTTESPTAEHGAPVIDPRGNVLGGNNRSMTLQRVYARGGQDADAYRQAVIDKAAQVGIDPAEVNKLKNPVLVRELQQQPSNGIAQKAITDFNKTSAAATPESGQVPHVQPTASEPPSASSALQSRPLRPSSETAAVTRSALFETADASYRPAAEGNRGRLYVNRAGMHVIDLATAHAEGSRPPNLWDEPDAGLSFSANDSPVISENLDRLARDPQLSTTARRIVGEVQRQFAMAVAHSRGKVRVVNGESTEPIRTTAREEDFHSEQYALGQGDGLRHITPELERRVGASSAFQDALNALPPQYDADAHPVRIIETAAHIAADGGKSLGLDRETAKRALWDYLDAVGSQHGMKGYGLVRAVVPFLRRDLASRFVERYRRPGPDLRRGDEGNNPEGPHTSNSRDASEGPSGVLRSHAEEPGRSLYRSAAEPERLREEIRGAVSRAPDRNAGPGATSPSAEREPREVDAERGAAHIGAVTLGLDKFVTEDVAPTAKDAARAIVETADDVLKILAPAARGRDAQQAALIMRNRLAELARRSDQAEASLAKAKKFFDRQSATDNYEFVNRMESGQAQKTPELDAIARVFRGMMDQRRAEVQALGKGKLQRFYENYFPHVWQNPKKAQNAFAGFFGRRPLEGGKSFLKARTHITFADGLSAGLKPVSDNPVDLVILKSREMDRYMMAHQVLEDWKDSKLAKFIPAQGYNRPAGWMKVDDPIGAVWGRSTDDELILRGNYWAPEGAARIMNNYLTPGLRAKGGYRALIGLNNVMNQFQLGLSAFHLGFTSADAAVSKAALGFEGLMRGKPVAAAKAFAGVPLAPFTTYLAGNRMLKEWSKPGSQGGAIAKVVNDLVTAGGRAHMDELYQTKIADKMRMAFRHGNVWGGLIRAPFAGVEALSNVIMKEIVPRQKMGVFADLARFEIERLGPGATFDEVRAALAKVWDSVEHRMGEMTYDNLFWNRTAKDLAMLGVRSVGWNLGTLREIGGGATDLVKAPIRMAGGTPPREINIHRIAYLIGLATVGAIMGALYQYLATGKGPQELQDYYFPKTGELDEAGRPQRASLPTYVKDVYHYATEPGKTLAGKVSPIWSAFAEMIRNEDFYGNQIRNEDDPLVEQMRDEVTHALGSFEPFGVRNEQREANLGAPLAQRAQQFVGITPAPVALEKSKAERLAGELVQSSIPAGGRTREQAERRDAEHEIARRARAGQAYAAQARDYLERGVLTTRDLRGAIERARLKPLAAEFEHLSLPDALKVWGAATDEERRQLRPVLVKKARSLRNEPPELERTLAPKVQAALAK